MDYPLETLTGSALLRLGSTPAGPRCAADEEDPPANQPDGEGPAADAVAAPMVVEHLRVRVPAACQEIWLEAERTCWEPWLQRQEGFLGRELLWDPQREEGVLLIRWASRDQWHAIPTAEVSLVQQAFERQARRLLREAFSHWGEGDTDREIASLTTGPFPLLYSGELEPAAALADAP